MGKCQFQLKRKTNFKCLRFPNLNNLWGPKCGNCLRAPVSLRLGSVALCVRVQAVLAFYSSYPHVLTCLQHPLLPACKWYCYFSPWPVYRTQTPESKGNEPTGLLKATVTIGPSSRRQAGSIRDLQGIQKVYLDQWEVSQTDRSQRWLLTDSTSYGLVRVAKASGWNDLDDVVTCYRKGTAHPGGPGKDTDSKCPGNLFLLAFWTPSKSQHLILWAGLYWLIYSGVVWNFLGKNFFPFFVCKLCQIFVVSYKFFASFLTSFLHKLPHPPFKFF